MTTSYAIANNFQGCTVQNSNINGLECRHTSKVNVRSRGNLCKLCKVHFRLNCSLQRGCFIYGIKCISSNFITSSFSMPGANCCIVDCPTYASKTIGCPLISTNLHKN